jgi:hypothetical protein
MIPARGTPETLVACHAVEEGRDGGPQLAETGAALAAS